MIRVAIAGDFCPRHRLERFIENKNYDQVLGNVKSFISDFDLSVVNLEAPVPTHECHPIKKDGPRLKCSEHALEALYFAGFDVVTLANNHLNDYGASGVMNTLKTCEYYGIGYVGAGKNSQDALSVKYLEIRGKIIALINCCEHEFSIATIDQPGANHIHPIKIFNQINEAKTNSDYVIIITHGGHEHYQLPSPRMKELFRFFVDAGADAVINHHQHCISGYEIYKDKPIAYGIGNFCFDRVNTYENKWNDGVIACLEFDEDKVSFQIQPFQQCSNVVGVVFDSKITKRILDEIESLNKIIEDDKLLLEAHYSFMEINARGFNAIFEPYYERVSLALFRRKILPSIITKTKFVINYGYIMCESHLDIVKYNLLKRRKKYE